MPETEADRVLKARAKQQRDQEEAAQRSKEAQDRTTQQSLVQQFAAEMPIVLRLLAKHGYPYAQLITIPDKSLKTTIIESIMGLFDSRRGHSIQKAAWRVGAYQTFFSGGGDSGYITHDIYLLSDGQIYMGGGTISSLKDVGIDGLRSSLDGIHELRRKLEVM